MWHARLWFVCPRLTYFQRLSELTYILIYIYTRYLSIRNSKLRYRGIDRRIIPCTNGYRKRNEHKTKSLIKHYGISKIKIRITGDGGELILSHFDDPEDSLHRDGLITVGSLEDYLLSEPPRSNKRTNRDFDIRFLSFLYRTQRF